jgi:hypothetical protein
MRARLQAAAKRRAQALGLALLGACAAGSQPATDAKEGPKGITISLGADDVQYDDVEQTADLTGNVRLAARDLPGPVPEVLMEAPQIRIALKPGDIAAPEGATVTAPGLRVAGRALWYNLNTNDFHAEDASSAVTLELDGRPVTLLATSGEIDSRGGVTELRQSSLTTCEHRHPHYAIGVDRARVTPAKDRVTVYGGNVELYGMRLPWPIRFNKSLGLREDSRDFDLDFPGYSGTDGWYYPLTRSFLPPEEPLQAKLNVRLTQRNLVVGRLLTSYTRPRTRLWGSVVRRDRVADDLTERLEYDALPEMGAAVSGALGPGAFSVELLGGYYREENLRTHARATESAATLKLDWAWRDAPAGRRRATWAGLGARGSVYGNGDSYRTVGLRAGTSRELWRHATGLVEVRHHFIGGGTPFERDDIDIQTEAFGQLSTALFGPWATTFSGRYDLHRRELRDYGVALHLRYHCLTWTVEYQKAHDRFGIGLNLSDFMFGGRPRPPQVPPGRVNPGGALSARPLQREGLAALPSVTDPSPEPPAPTPTQLLVGAGTQQRAPDPAVALRLRPPPSLQLDPIGVF